MVIDIRGKELKNNSLISLPEYFKKGWLGGTTLKKAYQNMKEYRMSSGVLRDMLNNGIISEENYLLAAEQVFLYGRAGRKIWIDCVQNYILFKMQHKEPEDASQMFIEMTDRIEDEDQLWVENNEEVDADKKLISYAENFDKEHIWMFDAGLVGRRSFSGNPKYLFIYINKYRPDICAYWICEKDATSIAEQVDKLGFYACVAGTEIADRMIEKTGVIVSELLRESYFGGMSKTKYLNLWHGIGFKRIERGIIDDSSDLRLGIAKKYITYNNYLLNNQIAVVTSDLYKQEFEDDLGLKEEQLIKTGYLRCLYQQNYEPVCTFDHDVIDGKILEKYSQIAVYAPTYRASRGNAFSAGMQNLEKLHKICEEKNMLMIFKMHPQIEKENGYINAKNKYAYAINFLFWDNSNDFYEIMNKVNLVIYDYSSIFSDFLCSGVKHFIRYLVGHTEDNGLYCRCDAFTSDSVELVSAYEVIEGSKQQNDKSVYDNYIRICAELGIEEQQIRNFMDYQTLTDFIISNTDEHLGNFGILRDSNTMQYLGPAPIYDSGNSMFFKDSLFSQTRLSLLQQSITSFYDSEEKMIKNIKNRHVVNMDLLPTIEETIALYTSYGFPEERAITIANNYALKIDMAREFENGATISMYHEKNNTEI